MTLKEAAPELDLAPQDRIENVAKKPRDHGDALAIAILVLLPTIVFAGADLFGGHLLLSGDNLHQNFPLRVLAGTDLRQGVLPFWDPFIWSGTPLLAGLNAGAFYPMSLLFAVASSHVAWVIGEIFVFSSVGVGTFLLFRSGGTSPFAAFLGAFSFASAGAVVSQTSVHIDMGDGLASLPWALLAVRRIGTDGRWRWALLLGAVLALAVVSGSPEAVLDITALCGAFALLSWWARRGTLWIYASRIAVGAVLALGLSAFIWIPALHFIAHSQRPGAGVSFASQYSFPPYAGFLGLVPYLEGGYSLFSQPAYFGQSNLGEIAIYVGILPVIATLTLLTRSWRKRIPRSELVCWYGVLVVGAVLAIGAGSPLEHLLYHVPFYGKQRDSGRNIVDVDLAACALFAWWVDGGRRSAIVSGGAASDSAASDSAASDSAASDSAASGSAASGSAASDSAASDSAIASDRVSAHRHDKVTALIPLAIVAVIGLMFVVSPGELWHLFRAVPPPPVGAAGSGEAILLALGLAAGAAVLVLMRSRARGAWWARVVAIFVVVDIGLFLIGNSYASAQQLPDASHPSPVVALVKANLSPAGRYAVFDPDLFDANQFIYAGEPDLGVLDALPSMSGYGSIVDATYAAQTGAQTRAFINIANLGEGRFEPLGLQVLVTVPESFLVPIAGPLVSGIPVKALAEQPGTDPALPAGNAPPPLPPMLNLGIAPGRAEIASGNSSGWLFGTNLALAGASVEIGQPAGGQTVRIGVLSSEGTKWGAPVHLAEGATTFQVPIGGLTGGGLAGGGLTGDGVELQVLSGPPLSSVRLAVETQGGRYYLAGGALANAVQPAQWEPVGMADDFAVFRARYTPQAAWLQEAGTERAAPGPSSAIAGTEAVVVNSATNDTTIETTTKSPALLVWSTSWDPGWTAQLVQPGGDKSLAVKRVGLVQGVEVPAGSSLIRFSYKPVGFSLGLILSLVTFVVLVVGCVSVFVVRRRRLTTSLARH